MKKIYNLLIACFLLTSISAYSATGTVDLSGKTLTDMDGTVWDLEQLQDDGIIIIFDFWATWCGPCIGSIPGLEDIWNVHGPAGDNTYVVFSIEDDFGTTNEAATVSANNITNPVIIADASTSVKNSDFAYTGSIPYFAVVCPSGSWIDRTGGIASNGDLLLDLGVDCIPTGTDDAQTSELKIASECPESDTWVPTFDLKNKGSNDLTSAKIEVSADGTVVETINWTGTLAFGSVETVDASPVTYTGVGVQNLSIEVKEVNGMTDSYTSNNVVAGDKSFTISKVLAIQLELIIDSYPEETGYQIIDEAGTVIEEVVAGAYAGATTNPIIDVTLPDSEKCYTVKLTDSYGDGSGGIIIKSEGNNLFENTTIYDNELDSKVYVSADSDGDGYTDVVEDLTGSDKNDASNDPTNFNVGIKDFGTVKAFNVFPNPAIDVLNVSIETNNTKNVSVELVDVLGRTIETNTVSNNIASFNVSKLNKGIYLVNVKSNGKSIATSSVVVK